MRDLIEIEPLKLPAEAWRDHKKLTRFLESVEACMNKLIGGLKQHSNLVARELLLRPNYAEEYESLRLNIAEQFNLD